MTAPMNVEALKTVLMEFVVVWGLRVIGVLVALVVGWAFAGWLSRKATHAIERRNIDATVARFIGNLLRWALIVAVVVGCLGVFGLETTSFAAVLASAGLAVGLAFQGTLSNFAAGIMLVVFRPFGAGDVVKVAGVIGSCEEIQLFSTVLKTADARRIIIPNSQVFGAVIENLSFYETRRVDVPVGVAYGADVSKTREVLTAAARSTEGVLDEPPAVAFLEKLGDSAVIWQVRAWAKTTDYWVVHEAIVRGAKEALGEAGLEIPYPTVDVNLIKDAAE